VPADSFGDYEILGTIGQGGMGVIYKARQRHTNRLVALKMIHAGPQVAREDVQRFRNEAETVASLDHPHIVPIYEVGEHDQQLYFSMKLVEGESLAQAVARGQWPGSGNAAQRQAARLLVAIAGPVHHAHQRGVLHRDLKPSNILLDKDGKPHVADFGLAKRLEADSSLTQSGALVGTPSYMAPEQTRGHRAGITTATDVYGLGTILYVLLTGRPPFQGDSALDTLRQVQEKDPEPPRARNPRVDRDLETICLKCLQKEPPRRYGSAEELAEDLERWLKGEPIQARRISAVRRLLKWSRRRPALAIGIGLSTASLLFLVLGTLWNNWRLQAAFEREHQQSLEAERQRNDAQHAFLELEEMSRDVEARWHPGDALAEKARRAVLERSLRFWQQRAEQEGPDDLARQLAARALTRVAWIQLRLGEHKRAEPAFQKARDGLAALATAESANPEYQKDLAIAWDGLAELLMVTGRLPAAQKASAEALVCCQTAASLAPADASLHAMVARVTTRQADVFREMGRLQEAEETYRQALKYQQRVITEDPAEANWQHSLAGLHTNLGLVLQSLGRPKDAQAQHRLAIASMRKLVDDFPGVAAFRNDLAKYLHNLAALLADTDELKQAESLFREAIALHARLVETFPKSPEYKQALANHYDGLGYVLPSLQRAEQAIAAYKQAIALHEELAASHPDIPRFRQALAMSLGGLGAALGDSGRPTDAEKSFRAAVAVSNKLASDFPRIPDYQSSLAVAEHNLALCLAKQGKLDEARRLFEQAVTHQQAAWQADRLHWEYRQKVAGHQVELMQALLLLKDHAEVAKIAAELLKVAPEGWKEYLEAAQYLARCLPLAQQDAKASAASRKRMTDGYAAQTVALLREAVRKGFRDVASLAKREDFAQLGAYEEFRQLIQQRNKPR
jgi:serine/threonine-protein kinase